MKKYLVAIDQGTTSTKVIIFDKLGNKIVSRKKHSINICNKPGYVEQNAEIIYENVVSLIKECVLKAKIKINEIISIGITNQRETTVIWDKKSGKPIYNAILWNSNHSKEICDEWINKGYNKIIKEKTGLLINPYFSASKIRWILDKCEYEDISSLCFGTIDSYLCYRLSGNKEHVSDVSNASRTMLFNIHTLDWDDELLDMFGIDKCILPKVVDTCGYKIKVEDKRITDEDLYVSAIVGDQQSALFGQGCINKGDIKDTFGTGCFILSNSGEQISESDNLVSTIAWRINGKVTYAIEGSIFLAGGLVEWLKEISLISSGSEISDINIDSNGVYFVPALSGLASPYWNSDIKGSFLGLTLATSRLNIISAVLESIAFSNKELIELMNKEMSNSIKSICVDGGLTLNNSLMRLQSNILSIDVYKNLENESTALGAALLAGLGMNEYGSIEEAISIIKSKELIEKTDSIKKYNSNYKKWKKAIRITSKF